MVVAMVTERRDPISQPPVGDVLGGYSEEGKGRGTSSDTINLTGVRTTSIAHS